MNVGNRIATDFGIRIDKFVSFACSFGQVQRSYPTGSFTLVLLLILLSDMGMEKPQPEKPHPWSTDYACNNPNTDQS